MLNEVKIPSTVTKIKSSAFSGCTGLTKIELPPQLEEVGYSSFYGCSGLTEISIPSSVKTIRSGAFQNCFNLESVTLSEGIGEIGTEAFRSTNLKSLNIPKSVKKLGHDIVDGCYHLAYITIEAPSQLEETFEGNEGVFHPACKTNVYFEPRLERKLWHFNEYADFITTVDVTLVDGDTITPKKIDYGADITALDKDKPTKPGYNFTGWYTDADCKTRYPDAQLFTNIKGTKLYAGWKFDPDALVCHPLTVIGGTVTVKYDDSDVTNTLTVTPDEATGKKTYDVPDGAKVTVTLDKTAVPNGKVFDSWSTGEFSLPQDQNYKAENITFTMNSDVDIAAQYRDAATDHTPDTAVCHPLTVTGGIVTVKNGDKDVTDTLTVTTDEATGKKTYSVPDGATVTVTLDKTLIPEGMVFDIWSTGKFSLPLGQDYKAETITFPMSSGVDIAAQYRDATIEDDEPDIVGPIVIGTTVVVGGAVLGYQAYSLGAEFAGKLMALPYFPSNRSALAMMLWEDAGKPMPESELLYPDVGQEERDMDLQHAARWAMENELIPDLNDEGTAPEEMKFYPDNAVSKIDVLNAWQKAQELKQNA
nr:leucine-rich repeat protein [Faecalibacterium prausnitzii]